ncbi:hypothetical protein [Sphingomonas sp.]|uniref:hypothetical protein n=1 Tax=Sphingomonas sp. TaxID=28214 RepID=UPI003B3AA339
MTYSESRRSDETDRRPPLSAPHGGAAASARDGKWVGWLAALTALTALCIFAQMIGPLLQIGHPISVNNNEGWNAYWTERALAGQPLYTGPASPLSDNYPPLSFYIVGLFNRALGDLVLTGRLLSLVALIGTGWLVGLIAARAGRPSVWAWFGGAIFLLVAVSMAPRYIAADDPQWMAEALQLIALALLITRCGGGFTPARLIGAAFVLLVAGLIKHNQVALPLAITGALAIHDRRALAVWIGAGVLVLGCALAGLHILYGPLFFDQVLHHVRTLHVESLKYGLFDLSYLLPGIVIAAVYLPRLPGWKQDSRLTLLALFAILALGFGMFERLGAGVSHNAHFDAIIAISILIGVLLSAAPPATLPIAARLSVMALVIAPAAIKDLVGIPHRIETVRTLAARDQAWRDTIRFLGTRPGPVACEMPALCYWAGKPYTLDFFNYGQKMRRIGDPWKLRARIAARQFDALVVARDDDYGTDNGRLPPDVYKLIEANYRIERTLPDNLYILVPIRPAAPSA